MKMRKTGQRGKRGDFPAAAVSCVRRLNPAFAHCTAESTARQGAGAHVLLEILCHSAEKIQASSLNFVPYPEITDCLGLAKWFIVFTCPCGDPVDWGLLSEASSYCISRMDTAWQGSLIRARPGWV